MIEKSHSSGTLNKLEGLYKNIITLVGEDVGRAGLVQTPKRAAKAILDFTDGYGQTPESKEAFKPTYNLNLRSLFFFQNKPKAWLKMLSLMKI
jgi:GTP cyclohydrolase I